MSKRTTYLGKRCFLFISLSLSLLGCQKTNTESHEIQHWVVTNGHLAVWSFYEGVIDARHMETIMSFLNGNALITELVPEGTVVRAGDWVAKFDSSDAEKEFAKESYDLVLAQAELDSLENAELPMELEDKKMRLEEERCKYETEKQYLEECRLLVKDGLISEPEIQQQEAKVRGFDVRLQQLSRQLSLWEEHTQPSRLEKARANLNAVKNRLLVVQQQLSNCVLRAPAAGTVVYNSVNIGTEYRTVRVGDMMYKNQPFMYIPAMSDFVVRSYAPEAELGRIAVGMRAEITPIAYPECRLRGTVENVSAMAQTRPEFPPWQKYFAVVVRIDDVDGKLRPGMSARLAVASCISDDSLLIPRTAVFWVDRVPYCIVRLRNKKEKRQLVLGQASDKYFNVVSGLVSGVEVVLP